MSDIDWKQPIPHGTITSVIRGMTDLILRLSVLPSTADYIGPSPIRL